ncbi:MAG: ATP-binding cassette domain-containing protein [Lachnospiraceae bacterium]|nr:ATP-binding cassette domain-containing protein [Lachnospiraceae bacterium]
MEPIIFGENLSFSYKEKEILKDLNFAFKKGERVGIVGESGSGKSTFLRLLAGLLSPTEGVVSVAGETKAEGIIKKISMVMQEAMLMPLTIKENITLGKDVPKERINEVIKAAKLDGWIDSLEEGIDTYLGDRANEISGGQAQRIAIARAMLKDADIILLDEPTSSLDKETTTEVLEALDRLMEGKTVVHVTHHPDLLKGYDRIITVKEGRFYE